VKRFERVRLQPCRRETQMAPAFRRRGTSPQRLKPISFLALAARLKRPLKKSSTQIPRGLKAARDGKNKGLRTAQLKLRPFKAALIRLFQRPVKACPFKAAVELRDRGDHTLLLVFA